MHVKQILARKRGGLITIDRKDTLETAVSLLAEHNIGTLLVVDRKGRFVGMLSERDIVRHLASESEAGSSWEVRGVMRPEVPTCHPSDPIAKVMQQMSRNRARHLPVLENDHLRGVISIGDVMKYRLDEMKIEADVLRDRLLGQLGNSRLSNR